MIKDIKLNLKLRIFLSLAVIYLATLGALTYLNIRSQKNQLIAHMDARARSGINLIELSVVAHLYRMDVSELNTLAKEAKAQPDVQYVYAYGPEGRILGDSSVKVKTFTIFTDELSQRIIKSNETIVHIDYEKGILDISKPVILGHQKIGGIRMGFNLNPLLREIRQVTLKGLGISIGIFLLGLFVIFNIVGRMTKPIEQLTQGAKRIKEGDLQYRVSLKRSDEIGDLALAFDQMADRLMRWEREQQERQSNLQWLLVTSQEIFSAASIHQIMEIVIGRASKALGVENVSLFLLDQVKGTISLRASVGLDKNRYDSYVFPPDDLLVRTLMGRPEVLVRDKLEIAQNGRELSDLARRMGEIDAEISLPLISKERLIGILILGHKGRRESYSHEDLEILSTLANQASIAIENAMLYENLKQSQGIIHRASRLSSLGMLTAGLAHEIRNPLVAIRTFTQLLPERYGDPEFRERFQSIALKEVDRISGLVNDLLSFARPSTPKVAREDINEVVKSIARILETEAKEKGVTINYHLAASLPKILVDKEQLKQVSMNVILNAIQSIENEGVVEISSRLFLKDNREHYIQIEVRDTGIGIPERDMENIFNPFFTTKKEGSGLGLSISHQIVKEHGGYMAVESKVGVGTSFYINLLASQVDYRREIDSPQIHEKDFGS